MSENWAEKLFGKDVVEKIRKEYERLEKEYISKGENVFKNLDYDDRLALMAYITRVLYNHMKEGGTYRYLIYDRLEFDMDSYAVLQLAGLLDVHNKLISD